MCEPCDSELSAPDSWRSASLRLSANRINRALCSLHYAPHAAKRLALQRCSQRTSLDRPFGWGRWIDYREGLSRESFEKVYSTVGENAEGLRQIFEKKTDCFKIFENHPSCVLNFPLLKPNYAMSSLSNLYNFRIFRRLIEKKLNKLINRLQQEFTGRSFDFSICPKSCKGKHSNVSNEWSNVLKYKRRNLSIFGPSNFGCFVIRSLCSKLFETLRIFQTFQIESFNIPLGRKVASPKISSNAN